MEIWVTKKVDYRNIDILMPILELRKILAPLQTGDIVELLTDDPAADLDLHAWSKLTGNKIIKIYQREKYTKYFIQKC